MDRRQVDAPPGRVHGGAPCGLYGVLELLIGVSASLGRLATIDLGYRLLRDTGGGLAWGSSYYYLASGAWVSLALLPWCTCMGATFPFAMAAIRRMRAGASEHSFSFLYLANVLGAIMDAGSGLRADRTVRILRHRYRSPALNALLALAVFFAEYAGGAGRFCKKISRGEISRGSAQRAQSQSIGAHSLAAIRHRLVQHGDGSDLDPRIHRVLRQCGVCLRGDSRHVPRGHIRRFTDLSAAHARTARWRLDPAWITVLLLLLFADPRFPLPEAQYTLQGFLLGRRAGWIRDGPLQWTRRIPDADAGGSMVCGRTRTARGTRMPSTSWGRSLGPLVSGFCVLPWAGEHWGLCIVTLPLFAIGLMQAFGGGKRKGLFAVCASASLLLLIFTRDYGTKFPHASNSATTPPR